MNEKSALRLLKKIGVCPCCDTDWLDICKPILRRWSIICYHCRYVKKFKSQSDLVDYCNSFKIDK